MEVIFLSQTSLQHSYTVTGYWRTTPSGKRVWVQAYKKAGTAAEDDLKRRVSEARARTQGAVDSAQQAYRDNYKQHKNVHSTATKQIMKLSTQQLQNARSNQLKEIENERNKQITGLDKVRLDAIEVAENTKIGVHNFIQDIKTDVKDIIDNPGEVVSNIIEQARTAVTGFFSRLFGGNNKVSEGRKKNITGNASGSINTTGYYGSNKVGNR